MIKDSEFLQLPHSRTLRDYTHYINFRPGRNAEILLKIKNDCDFDSLPEFKRNILIAFDEIKIKQGLVYSSETGELIGFCQLGNITMPDVNCSIPSLGDFVQCCM